MLRLGGRRTGGREHAHGLTVFVFPTRRRVHHHYADGVADQSFAGITIDIDDVAVA
jgi:hypothetical protein